MAWFDCTVCEDPQLVLTAGLGIQNSYLWRLTCGNGHEWVAVPGTVLVIKPGVSIPAEIAHLDL